MPEIPFLDVGYTYRTIRSDVDLAYHRVMESGWYILGREVTSFESAFASLIGVRGAVGISNGLDALTLTLRAMGVGAGDEVIVPGHTFIASWLAVSAVGATPVPIDVDNDTMNLNPDLIEAAVTGQTRAIMPVHLYGQPCDMDRINGVAAQFGLRVVEDAAQAVGARW